MRSWVPQSVYEAKPYVFMTLGAVLTAGLWTVWRSFLCFLGAGIAIAGGATLQLRQDYRAKSKWRRDHR